MPGAKGERADRLRAADEMVLWTCVALRPGVCGNQGMELGMFDLLPGLGASRCSTRWLGVSTYVLTRVFVACGFGFGRVQFSAWAGEMSVVLCSGLERFRVESGFGLNTVRCWCCSGRCR